VDFVLRVESSWFTKQGNRVSSFLNMFKRKKTVNEDDAKLLELLMVSHVAIQQLRRGELTEKELIAVLAQACLFVPLIEPPKGSPENPLNWKPTMVNKDGVFYQIAFSSLELAADFQQKNPYLSSGRIFKSEWIIRAAPVGHGLAINGGSKHFLILPPIAIEACNKVLSSINDA
jgi:hypothetical protein